MIGNLALASALALAPAITDKKTNPYKSNLTTQTVIEPTYIKQDSNNKYGEGKIENQIYGNIEYKTFFGQGGNNAESITLLKINGNGIQQNLSGSFVNTITGSYPPASWDRYTRVFELRTDKYNLYNNINEELSLSMIKYNMEQTLTWWVSGTLQEYPFVLTQQETTLTNNLTAFDISTKPTSIYVYYCPAPSTFNIDTTINLTIDYEVAPIETEVIDLPGLMFQILGMPFAFISQAFNLTLFAGTPYSVNVSNLLFFIIAGLIVIVIIKKVLK